MALSQANEPVTVSVVIPTHNHATYLWEAISSVLNQTLTVTCEVIVVDDASTDDASAVARHFGARYIRIEKQNVCEARNIGTSHARGEIIVYLDADNYLLPNFLAETIPLIQANTADVVYGQRLNIGDYLPARDYNHFNTFLPTRSSLRITSSIDTCSAVRRSLLTDKPWDPRIKRYTDWDFHLTNMENGLRYHFVDRPLFAYRHFNREADAKRQINDLTVKADCYIREKHGLNSNIDDTEVTILLPTIGRYYCFEKWIDALWQLDYPKDKIDLLFIDNSADPDFYGQTLLPVIKKAQRHYHAVAVRHFHSQPIYHAHLTENEQSQLRVMRAAEIMNYALDHQSNPFLFNLDDDTTCAPITLKRLMDLLRQHPEAGGAAVVQRSRRTLMAAVAYEWQEGRPLNLFYRRGTGVEKITTIGTGCILYPTREFINYRFTEIPGDYGIDLSYGYKLHLEGRYLVTDWQLEAPHHVLSPSGKEFTLTFKDFSQPPELFPIEALDKQDYVPPRRLNEMQLIPTQPRPWQATFCLHDVEDIEQVSGWFKATETDPANIKALHLFPANRNAWRELSSHHWPARTVLHPAKGNRLEAYNQILKETGGHVVISSIKLTTILHPARTAGSLLSFHQPIVLGVEAWSSQSTNEPDFFLAFNHRTMQLGYTDQPDAGHNRLVGSINCCLIDADMVADIFDTRYDQVPFLAALALQLAAKRTELPVAIAPNLISISKKPVSRENTPQFYELAGIFTARQIPYRRWLSWWRQTIVKEWRAPTSLQFRFWLALIREASLKLRQRHHRYHVGYRF